MGPELVLGAPPTPPLSGTSGAPPGGQAQADAVSSNGQARVIHMHNVLQHGNGGGASMADLCLLVQRTLHSTARTEIATLEIRRQIADLGEVVKDLASRLRGPSVHLIRVLNARPEARRAIKFPITCWAEFVDATEAVLAAEERLRSGSPSPPSPPVADPAPSSSSKRKAPEQPAAPSTLDD
ncbi:hypothetical protein ACQJBY_051814 [Aegilops geniculata]